jgi:hypothetical protein
MTPAAAPAEAEEHSNEADLNTVASQPAEDIMPDWADASSRAEAAANTQANLEAASSGVALSDMNSLSPSDDDPYGILDFTDHFEPFDSEDEAEMRRELAKHRGALGLGWFDGMVDVLLRFEDAPGREAGETDTEERVGRARAGVRRREIEEETLQDGEVEAPPENRGVWGDVAWFGRMLARSVRS